MKTVLCIVSDLTFDLLRMSRHAGEGERILTLPELKSAGFRPIGLVYEMTSDNEVRMANGGRRHGNQCSTGRWPDPQASSAERKNSFHFRQSGLFASCAGSCQYFSKGTGEPSPLTSEARSSSHQKPGEKALESHLLNLYRSNDKFGG